MSEDGSRTFKLGRHEAGVGMVEHRHGGVFERQSMGGHQVLVVAPATGHIDLLIRLSRRFEGPFAVVYVLLVPFGGYAEGRYRLSLPLDHDALELFLHRFEEFFERDARHHLHVGDSGGGSVLVYDQHNYIYTLRPSEAFEEWVRTEGFRPGEVALPIPHSHHHHPEFDGILAELLKGYEWDYSPLSNED